ncbi:MAG TPA: hypothetical protein DD755_10080 [Erysipelotrichaceae bacterium]|nr:hypothetical protein [Erysipelotrichaceae bacterium]
MLLVYDESTCGCFFFDEKAVMQ